MYCLLFSLLNHIRRQTVFFIIVLVLFGSGTYAATSNKDFFLYGDFIHKNNIRTVLFSQKDFELSDPIIRLNSNDKLILRFDDLDADYKHYSYTIIHCDADWSVSDLRIYDYIDGFYEDEIRDFRFSINTRAPFTHYYLEFPNHNMRPLRSGNYILKVFVNGDPNHVAFTRRFMVLEERLSIQGHVQQANLVRYRDRKQQLLFSINPGNYRITNPYRDLKVVITQNGRWDNAIQDLMPRTIQGNTLLYDHEDKTLFEGGNEFRRFDIRSLRSLSERLQDITSSRRHWDVFLTPDHRRVFHRYVSDDDINGRFMIETRDARDKHLEGDYAWVHFKLPMDAPPDKGYLYVMGALTDWHLSEESKMNYNYGEKAYELSLLLKQGYYNYMYAYVEKEEGPVDVMFAEGSHSQTENDYSIFVYHREPGDLYDRLVGFMRMNSGVPR
ncbi:MAG: DUF5103 domain-containing protein [Bacteroidales bacterium]|nr:DUF5103 domain-containing protein [Bacteroidales bacterium]